MRRAVPFLAALLLAAAPSLAQDAQEPPPRRAGPAPSRFTFGGSVGFGFGSVTWVGLAGEVGYLATDRIWVGTSGSFRYTNDTRYEPAFSAVDYSFGAFGRYFVFDRFFADVEWVWTSYESRTFVAERSSVTSVLVGAGYGQPLGGRTNVVFEVLYDVTGNAQGIYGTPWVVRAGFTMGF